MIAILDYGAGNLRSVQNTLDEIGARYELVRNAAGLKRATKIILPGVGHFGQMLRAIDEMTVRETLVGRIREGVPFLGICLGLQCAVIEFARHVAGLDDANSTEVDRNCPHPVVCLLDEQYSITHLGGTMRLGSYPCALAEGSRAHQAYRSLEAHERHRHRYEFNNAYRDKFEKADFIFSGTSPDGNLVEVIELPNHPFFIASQFHPEFRSKPHQPHPLFKGFIGAAHEHIHHRPR